MRHGAFLAAHDAFHNMSMVISCLNNTDAFWVREIDHGSKVSRVKDGIVLSIIFQIPPADRAVPSSGGEYRALLVGECNFYIGLCWRV